MSEEQLAKAKAILYYKENHELKQEIERLNNDIKELLKENENKEKVIKTQDNNINELEKWVVESIEKHTEDYKNKVSYLEILVYRLNNLISYLLENSDEATSLYEDYKAKKIDKDIKKELERLRESEEYHKKGFAELHKRIEEAIKE